MSNWILQHFMNPSFFWPGVALVSLPIIIHLIHRLRYRRVRFAAMEFLLASQKKNKSRVFLEQLLLLLMRIAMVLLVLALIGRLILDPSQLSLFQGAQSHHVIVLDDTVSMQDRDGENSVFDAAKDVVRKMVAEGARRPGAQKLTLIRVSKPDETLSGLSQRTVDQALMTEISERLDVMSATHQSTDPALALDAAVQRLNEDRASVRHVHVLSDFRSSNWIDNKAAVASLQQLSRAEVELNLVRCVSSAHENLSVSDVSGAVEVAAAGVPVMLKGTVTNYGTREVENVRASLFVDGERLPRTIDFQTIAAGESSTRSFDVVFETAQPHEVRLSIGEDSLAADNTRFLAVDVPVDNPVLLIDGSPGTEQAFYVADALAADKSVTGLAPEIRSPDDLRRMPLEKYHLIYMINVPELAPDAVAAVEEYVKEGGGLIWYMGDAIRPAYYNEKLFAETDALFPVRLGVAPEVMQRVDSGATLADIESGPSPLFDLFNNADVPILDLVFVNLYYPVDHSREGNATVQDAIPLAELRNGAPLMYEHQLGEGRIFTCLTSAGPLMNPEGLFWTNWANGPASFSFAVFQLELAKRYVRTDRSLPVQNAGKAIDFRFNQAFYQPDVTITSPDDQVVRMQASPAASDGEDLVPGEAPQLHLAYRDTDLPGVYDVTLTTQDAEPELRKYAVNVDAKEGALKVMEDDKLRAALGEKVDVTIQSAGSSEWIRSESPGSELRRFLLILVALLCIAEQWLASRLSYVE